MSEQKGTKAERTPTQLLPPSGIPEPGGAIDLAETPFAAFSTGQLAWRRFRRHKLAVFGLGILGLFILMVMFAEFIGPYPPGQRDTKYVAGPPMIPKIIAPTASRRQEGC